MLRDAVDSDAKDFGELIVEAALVLHRQAPGRVALVTDADHALIAVRVEGLSRAVLGHLPEDFDQRARASASGSRSRRAQEV